MNQDFKNAKKLYEAAKAAENYLQGHRADHVIEILREEYKVSLPQAREAVKIATLRNLINNTHISDY